MVNTVSVDRLNFFDKASIDQDLRMNGYVTYVGTTTIVVNIDLCKLENHEFIPISHATFVLRAHDLDGHPIELPQIKFKGESNLMGAKT